MTQSDRFQWLSVVNSLFYLKNFGGKVLWLLLIFWWRITHSSVKMGNSILEDKASRSDQCTKITLVLALLALYRTFKIWNVSDSYFSHSCDCKSANENRNISLKLDTYYSISACWKFTHRSLSLYDWRRTTASDTYEHRDQYEWSKNSFRSQYAVRCIFKKL